MAALDIKAHYFPLFQNGTAGYGMRRSKVYVLQKPHHPRDLSNMEEFGELIWILEPEENSSCDPSNCFFKMRQALKNFEPEDHLAFVGGDPHSLLLAATALPPINPIKFLRWDREISGGVRTGKGTYVSVTLENKHG